MNQKPDRNDDDDGDGDDDDGVDQLYDTPWEFVARPPGLAAVATRIASQQQQQQHLQLKPAVIASTASSNSPQSSSSSSSSSSSAFAFQRSPPSRPQQKEHADPRPRSTPSIIASITPVPQQQQLNNVSPTHAPGSRDQLLLLHHSHRSSPTTSSSSSSSPALAHSHHHHYEQQQQQHHEYSIPPLSPPVVKVPPSGRRFTKSRSSKPTGSGLPPPPPLPTSSFDVVDNGLSVEDGLFVELAVDRTEAEKRLNGCPPGDYIIRARSNWKNSNGSAALSLATANEVVHIKLERRAGVWVVGEGPAYGALSAVVAHYSRQPLPIRHAAHVTLRTCRNRRHNIL